LTAAIGFRLLLGWFWVTPAAPKRSGPSTNSFRFFIGRLCETAWRLTQTPYNPVVPDSRFSNHNSRITFSCSRPRLRTPHRQRRRRRVYLRPLPRHRLVAFQGRVADLDPARPALTLFYKGRR